MDNETPLRAMVLCAGYGTRLGDLTRMVPKPMLLVAGRPLLEYLLSHLAHHGFREVAINLHFMPRTIKDHFGIGLEWNLKITYSEEAELLGTAGGLKKMSSFFHNASPFLVQYGDVLTDEDFSSMIRFHNDRRALVTMLVHRRYGSNSVVNLDEEGRITGFLERPSAMERSGNDSPWVNSAVYVCSPEFLDAIPDRTPCDIPRDVIPSLIPTRRVFGYPLTGYRCAIDSPQRLDEAQEAVTSEKCRITIDRNGS